MRTTVVVTTTFLSLIVSTYGLIDQCEPTKLPSQPQQYTATREFEGNRFTVPDNYKIETVSRAAVVARSENGSWLIYDRQEKFEVFYRLYAYFPRTRPANISHFYYTVSCDLLLPKIDCNTFRAIVRFGLAYALAWLNTPDWGEEKATRFPRIQLQEVSYDRFVGGGKRATGKLVTHIRLQDFRRPIPSPHGTWYPKNNTESLLGQATQYSVDLSVNGNYYFDDLRDNMKELRELLPSQMRRSIDESRSFYELPESRLPCSTSFMNVYVHELLHTLLLGHADLPESLIFFASLGRMNSPRNDQLGGIKIINNDIIMLRHRWGRSNVYLPMEFMRIGRYKQEFALLVADWQWNNDTVAPITTTTTTTIPASTTTPSDSTTTAPIDRFIVNMDFHDNYMVNLLQRSIGRWLNDRVLLDESVKKIKEKINRRASEPVETMTIPESRDDDSRNTWLRVFLSRPPFNVQS